MASITIFIPDKRRKEILDALSRFKQSAEISSGCIACQITRDLYRRNMICYIEEWQTREDLEKHIHSSNYRQLLEIIESSEQKPEIKFLSISKVEGLEVVKTVRISR